MNRALKLLLVGVALAVSLAMTRSAQPPPDTQLRREFGEQKPGFIGRWLIGFHDEHVGVRLIVAVLVYILSARELSTAA